MVKIGTSIIKDIRVGSNRIDRVYLGSDLVFVNQSWAGDFVITSGSVNRFCPAGDYEVELLGQGGGSIIARAFTTSPTFRAATGGSGAYLKFSVSLSEGGVYQFAISDWGGARDGASIDSRSSVVQTATAHQGADSVAFSNDDQSNPYVSAAGGGYGGGISSSTPSGGAGGSGYALGSAISVIEKVNGNPGGSDSTFNSGETLLGGFSPKFPNDTSNGKGSGGRAFYNTGVENGKSGFVSVKFLG